MRLLCICVLIVSTAGLCRGGAEEQLSRRERVTVTCRDGNNEMIQLWCHVEKLTCSSGGEEEKNDQFAIQEPYENHLFRVRKRGGRNSHSITYNCHMTVTSVVPSSNLGSLHSENIPHGDPISKKAQVQIRKARESDKNSRQNSKEKRAEEKKDKGRSKKNKPKKHKDKTSKGSRRNEPEDNDNNSTHDDPNESDGNFSPEGDDPGDSDEEEDHSHNGNQPGGGNGKDENEGSTSDTTNETKTKTTTERTSTKDGFYSQPYSEPGSTSDNHDASNREDVSEDTDKYPVESDIPYNVIIVLMVVLLILAVCSFFLWKRKKKAQGQHKAAGSSAQVEPEKTVVTVYPTAKNPRDPTYTQPDRIYQEIADTPV